MVRSLGPAIPQQYGRFGFPTYGKQSIQDGVQVSFDSFNGKYLLGAKRDCQGMAEEKLKSFMRAPEPLTD